MSPRTLFAVILLAVIIPGRKAAGQAQDSGPSDGKILRIGCDARLAKKDSATWRSLHSPQDVGLPLFAGDQVKCVGAGSIEILLPEGKRPITAAQGTFSVVPVQIPPDADRAKTSVPRDLIASQLHKLGVVGATRGQVAGSRILWPADGSAVLPESFVIRWAPVPGKISVSILSESKDQRLWGPTETEGETGELKLSSASSALADYRKNSARTGLILTLAPAESSDWEEVRFSIPSSKQQQELTEQLDFWEKNSDGLELRLGRGYSYTRQKLFAEAAEEYDAALSSAPGSRYLLEDAVQANRLAGRAARVKELQSQLASLPPAAHP